MMHNFDVASLLARNSYIYSFTECFYLEIDSVPQDLHQSTQGQSSAI